MVRKRIAFAGRVQGVGFRWRAEKAADMFRCTGWCRNEWDGTVSMEIRSLMVKDILQRSDDE